MDVVLGLGLFVAIMGIAWALVRQQFSFLVRIGGGRAKLATGKVTTAFLHQLEQACAEFGVSRGWIGGIARGRQTRLVFSSKIPPHVRQRLRNLWHLQG